jgi:rubrerythrin
MNAPEQTTDRIGPAQRWLRDWNRECVICGHKWQGSENDDCPICRSRALGERSNHLG